MTATRRLFIATLAALPLAALAAPPTVDGAWVRPTVAGQTGGGGFLRITGGSAADRLVGARSDAAMAVEIHTMAMQGDTMTMRPVDGVDVPAGATVALKPGGLHLMLMGLKAPLKTGTEVPVVLRFQKAGEVPVTMRVSPTPPK